MTQKKHIAESILFMLTDPIVENILDLSANITDTIEEVSSWWKFDLMKRNPSPAYYDKDGFHATDLDLACFMYSLVGRGAVINIPTYKSKTGKREKLSEKVISANNRHGEVINLNSNQNFFSFSVRIKDLNVVKEDSVGAYRNFMLTDYDGEFYKGWRTIEFTPTLKENKFLTESELWTDNKIYFKNFVSPNRWTSFFGRHYIITKMLIERLKLEAKFYNAAWKVINKSGIRFPEGTGPQPYEYGEKGETISKKFPAFEAKIVHPGFVKDFPAVSQDLEGMMWAYNKQKFFTYTIVPRLQFMTRATELAHYRHPDRFPAWIKNTKWESGYKESPRARTLWDRLILFQPEPGQPAVSIIKRSFEKATQIAA
jgi:hypothetical protein